MRKLTAIWRRLPPFYTKKEDVNLPWVQTWKSIDQRCKRKGSYKEKGIKNLITPFELKLLWFRDSALSMKRPSIHRKDNSKNYVFNNCQYVEYAFNCGRRDITKEFRIRCSKKVKMQWKDPEFRRIHLTCSSSVMKKLWLNPEFRKRHLKRLKESNKKMNLDLNQIKRRQNQGRKQMLLNWNDSEFRRMRSECVKRQWKKGIFKRKLKGDKK